MSKQVVVMVAEKPSIASAASKILSKGKCRAVGHGSIPVYEFEMTFNGRPSLVKFTSVTGHVFSKDFPPAFQNWSQDPILLFSAPTIRVKAGNKGVSKHLKAVCSGANHLILWLDNDREGENICFEVMDIVTKVMRPANKGDQKSYIHRAIFSAITETEINHAMANLRSPDKNQSNAVEVRQEIDLKIGVAFTRFQSNYFGSRYRELSHKPISFGPCQTPTLAFCVERHDKILSFQPEPYWVLQILLPNCSPDDDERMAKASAVARSNPSFAIAAKWEGGRIMNLTKAKTMEKSITSGASTVVVEKVDSKTKNKQKPKALDTVNMLQLASKVLGISPSQTMCIAEDLYMSGYISYPRTETSSYPESMDLRAVVKALSTGYGSVSERANKLLEDGIHIPTGGKNSGDHPPITPTNPIRQGSSLSGLGEKLYNLISNNFLASLSTNCKIQKTKVTFVTSKQPNMKFVLEGSRIVDPGYLSYVTSELDDDSILIPNYKVGQTIPICGTDIKEKMTKPPSELTEAELLAKMDKHGIGTDASMATHIENICARGYVVPDRNSRHLIPTPLGISLIHGYRAIDNELVSPFLRSNIEKNIAKVADGKIPAGVVLKYSLDTFLKKYNNYVANISVMEALIAARIERTESGPNSINAHKLISRCGRCKRYMYIVQNPPKTNMENDDDRVEDMYSRQGLYCEYCDMLYFIPQKRGGNFKSYNVKSAGGPVCPLDQFEILECVDERTKWRTTFCPYCYNNRKDENRPIRCIDCKEDCKFSSVMTEVGKCPCCGSSKQPKPAQDHSRYKPKTRQPKSDPRIKDIEDHTTSGTLYVSTTCPTLICNTCETIFVAKDCNCLSITIPQPKERCACGRVKIQVKLKQDKTTSTETICPVCSGTFVASTGRGKGGKRYGKGRKPYHRK